MGERIPVFPYDAKLAALGRLNSAVGIVIQVGVNEFDVIPYSGATIPNESVIYVADPNAEGLMPLDPTRPCVAYSQDGTGAMMGWNVTLGIWQ